MKNFTKSRWFKFVLRTLIDWIVLVLIVIIIGIVKNIIVDPPVCTHGSTFRQRQNIVGNKNHADDLKEEIDSAQIPTKRAVQ